MHHCRLKFLATMQSCRHAIQSGYDDWDDAHEELRLTAGRDRCGGRVERLRSSRRIFGTKLLASTLPARCFMLFKPAHIFYPRLGHVEQDTPRGGWQRRHEAGIRGEVSSLAECRSFHQIQGAILAGGELARQGVIRDTSGILVSGELLPSFIYTDKAKIRHHVSIPRPGQDFNIGDTSLQLAKGNRSHSFVTIHHVSSFPGNMPPSEPCIMTTEF